ncbi:MAG: hypothetical protein ACE366_07775 [Bradymonadia bacterium]
MAEITLTLKRDPQTGRRELIVHYESEDDALPHEHERDHRDAVEALLGRSLDALIEELGGVDGVELERIRKPTAEESAQAEATAAQARERLKH